MTRRFLYIFIFFAFFKTAISAEEFSSLPSENLISDIYLLSVRRNEGSTVGNKISYSTLEALSFPINYQNLYPFLDLRAHGFGESGQNAANAGLGIRYASNFTKTILGANVYYDYRKIHSRSYNQFGIGLESLGPCLNFRLNAYLPIGKKTHFRSSTYCENSNGYYMIEEKYEDSLRGVDFEAEVRAARICCTDIYLAIGGYYYKRRKCGGDILGSEYRITINPCCWWGFSLRATHDCHYKTRIQGELTFTLPIHTRGCENPCSIQFQPIRRQEMIVLDKHDMYIWNW